MTDTGPPRTTTTPTPASAVPAPRAGVESQPSATPSPTTPTQPTGWVGWIGFAAFMMFLVSAFQIIQGLVAIFDRSYYQVSKRIREMCIFARQNVFKDPPFSKLDLISCRNVLIYLGPVLQKRIIPMFHYAVLPTRGAGAFRSEVAACPVALQHRVRQTADQSGVVGFSASREDRHVDCRAAGRHAAAAQRPL